MKSQNSQQVRPTQFLTTYGPGAIIDSLSGPRLIYRLADSGVLRGRSISEFEIAEPALSQLLPEPGRIFRLPTNADFENLNDSEPIYETRPFPGWSLCPSHGVLYRKRPSGDGQQKDTVACPKCPRFDRRYEAWYRAREQAVNFVLVCRNGHLSDVPWSYLVHRRAGVEDCMPDTFWWRGAGGPIRDVSLECPTCEARAKLSDLYHREHSCSGRRPEFKDYLPDDCSLPARISQRAASDLFLPELRTTLTLPSLDSALHDALRNDHIFTQLERDMRARNELDEEGWEMLLSASRIPQELRERVRAAQIQERNRAAQEVLEESRVTDEGRARGKELKVLKEAGRDSNLRSRNFELDVAGAREMTFQALSLRVTPVTRLRMTSTQIGYRRLGGEVVDSGWRINGELWYPGIEQFGEGLFIETTAPLETGGPVWQAWQARYEAEGQVQDSPYMVWWHTLSHRLILSLAVHSGYSAASVRERLYLSENEGGLLVYAVQPGGDGTLGGLIALVPRFERLLRAALVNLDCCSNDPLCGEQKISKNRQNGAACYACSLLSETSCEMRNLSLDRNLLLETLSRH